MSTREINPGDTVLARNAFGEDNQRRAITGIVQGGDFAVVWICTDEEWAASLQENRDPDGVPWPAEDVRVATPA